MEMHEEQQPPEYQSTWSASQDSADDHVTPDRGDAGEALDSGIPAAEPGTQEPGADSPAGGHEPAGSYEPAGGDEPAGGYEHPTMIYAPPGSYVPPGADEPGAGGGYGAPGENYGPGGYGPGSGAPGSGAPGHGAPGYGAPGYGAAGYGAEPGYGGDSGYGGGPGYPGGYGPGGYGPGGQYPPGGAGYGLPGDVIGGGYGEERPPRRGTRVLTYVVVAALAAGVGAGTVLALNHNSGGASQPSVSLPGAGAVPRPGSGTGSGGSTNASSSVMQAVNRKVSPGIVDVISQPAYQTGTLEGTGMILSRSGLVLTNNHVVEGTSSVQAKIANTGKTYSVKVIGTDATDDVALLQLIGAANLTPVPLGNSNTVRVGDAVVALGNADGQDGPPTVVSGKVTSLNQSIKASDQGAGTTENLHGMLQTNAPIISGDSGGALANAQGQVIGMNTAANSTPNLGGGSSGQGTTSMGFAIPIDRALSIAQLIAGGHASAKIQIGLPAFLGVTVARASSGNGSSNATSPQAQWQELRQAAQTQNGFGGFGGGGQGGSNGSSGCLGSSDSSSVPSHIANVSSGALIGGVLCKTPVASAGMTAGSVITSINGQAVSSPNALTKLLTQYHPGNTISVVWVAPNGKQRTSSLQLASGPAK